MYKITKRSQNKYTRIINIKPLIFFFHPDHLGSTSYVTGADGTVAQHVEYIPYGEVFVEERSGTVGTAYLFNAKELDDETGMYYYGARYLDPVAAMWISVDPMWEKFAGMSAYNYCAGNPVKMVDPDGRYFDEADTKYLDETFIKKGNELKQKYQTKITEALNKTDNNKWSQKKVDKYNQKIKEIDDTFKEIDVLKGSSQKYKFDFGWSGSSKGTDIEYFGQTDYDDESDAVVVSVSGGKDAYGTIAHELKHAYQSETGELSFRNGGVAALYDMTDENECHQRGWAWGVGSRYPDSGAYPNLKNRNTRLGVSVFNKGPQLKSLYDNQKNNEYFRYENNTYKPNSSK